MRRRQGRGHTRPFSPLDSLRARLGGAHGYVHYRAGEITRERWLEHGAPVMTQAQDGDRDPWPWLLWGDPRGWYSAPGTRRTALLAALGQAERHHAHPHDFLAALRQALAELGPADPALDGST